MRTSLNVPGTLVVEAQKLTGVKTKTQAIVLALTERIQRRKSRGILQLRGSLAHAYDYKVSRRKR